jgi:hypothetical protein
MRGAAAECSTEYLTFSFSPDKTSLLEKIKINNDAERKTINFSILNPILKKIN